MHLSYVLVFTQVTFKRECYTSTPKGIEEHRNSYWVLKVKNNIYGKHQKGRVWNKILVEKLTSSPFRFRKRKVDKCVFDWGKAFIYCTLTILL